MSDYEYILKKDLTEDEAFFSFIGDFQQVRVTWHVHLCTCRSHVFDNIEIKRQLIVIEESPVADHYKAYVCLNIPRISLADITKTIIMIRQYKKLCLGRHEYGEPF